MLNPRVLHLADLHICLSGPRREECVRILDWIASNAKDVKPDVIVIAGDVFNRRSAPLERIYLAQFLQALSDVAPVVIISGNHDDPEDLKLFRAEYGWQLRVDVVTEPKVTDRGGVGLALLPWPVLGNLAKVEGIDSIVMRREVAKAALLDIVRGFRLENAASLPSLLIVHMPITGASMDSGQPVSSSEEIALSAEELLESGCAAVLAGHIHLRQTMKTADPRPIMYAGAPFRGSFGEAKGTKGGLIWDWDGKTWQVTPWDTPARDMVLLEYTWIPPEEGIMLDPNPGPIVTDQDVRDADVRVRITFPAEFREAMREAMAPQLDALRAAAHSVTVEERPTIISRTRCIEITTARTTIEKLRAWSQAVGTDVPEGAEAKLGILEAGVAS